MPEEKIGPLLKEENTLPPSLAEFPRRNEIVERLFNPHEEVDQHGFKRRVYVYEGFTFAFRGREELPIIPAARKESASLLGSTPVQVNQEQFEAYRRTIEGSDPGLSESSRCFVATKDILGVLALVNQFVPSNAFIGSSLREVRNGIYSDGTLDIIDSLIACNWVTESRAAWKGEEGVSGADAEIIVLASLLGDKEATKYIRRQKKKMVRLDQERREKKRAKLERQWKLCEENVPAKMSELVGIHATDYFPRATQDGYEIPTTGEATGWEYLRNTCHITLNHKVQSHYGGKWDLKPVTIISPFELMLEANGNPTVIQENDTWWTRNPGETLKFPQASIVRPGIIPEGKLFVVKGRETFFKAGNYTLGDLVAVEVEEEGYSFCWQDFENGLIELKKGEKISALEMEKIKGLLVKRYFKYPHDVSYDDIVSFGNLFKSGGDEVSVKDRVGQILEGAGLSKVFPAEVLAVLLLGFASTIENRLFEAINEEAIKETLTTRRYPPSYNGDIGALLGRKLEAVVASPHISSIYHSLEEVHGFQVEKATTEKGDGKTTFNWQNFNFRFELSSDFLDKIGNALSELDEKIRRVVYVSGCTSSRM